jgi:acyl-CoA hydrolase
MGGYGMAEPIAAGRMTYAPIRLGSVPHFLEHTLRPHIVVVPGVARGSGFAYRGSVGWGPAAVRAGDLVVIEVADGAVDHGGPLIDCTPDLVVDVEPSVGMPPDREPDAVDLAVGRNVASLVRDGMSVQLGPGGIADAIVASIDRPVGIFSGLLTDRMAALAERGLLRGVAVAGYLWGGADIDALAAEGRLDFQSVEVTHHLGVLSGVEGMLACNTALQLGLDGSVNVERIGSRLVAGIGGHADFCAGASRAPGGLSVIALRSTTRSGGSTIVAQVDQVSTPRCDVDIVVTEHGIADLRGLGDRARADAITAVAAPEHRDALAC